MDQATTDRPMMTSTDDEGWSLSLVEAAGEAGVLGDPSAGVFWEAANQSVSDCGWIGIDNGSVACLFGGLDANQSHLFDEGVSVSAADRQYWAMVLIVFPLFTVFGNVLVVLSVWREKSLQSVTNYFIVSLAISDIMVALLVMPLSIYVEVNRSIWELGDATCDMWVAFDVMCCTASILNLTAISVDRFIAVTQPIKYARHKNSKRVYITLALTWVISLAISSPIALGMNYTERRLQTPTLCTFYNSDFLIYSSMGSFYIPCIVMVLLYSKIFLAIRRRAKNAAVHKKYLTAASAADTTSARNRKTEATVNQRTEVVETEKRHLTDIRRRKEEEEKDEQEENAKTRARKDSQVNTALAANSGDFEITVVGQLQGLVPETKKSTPSTVDTSSGQRDFDVITTHVNQESLPVYGNQTDRSTTDWYLSPAPEDEDDGGINTVGYRRPLTVEVVGMETQKGLDRTEPDITCQGHPRSGGGSSSSNHSAKRRRSNNGGMEKKKTTTTTTVTKFNFHFRQKPEQQKPKRRDKGASRRERKATKTLAIVLGVFLFCWVPFFTINIINAICIRYNLFDNHSVCQIDPILFSFLVWLGYMNSFLNPAIYTIFNAEFRRVFQKLLLSRCSR